MPTEKSNTKTLTKAEPQKRAAKTAPKEEETKQTFVAKDIDPNQYVTVRNGFQGKLVYISKHTGEKYVWDSFGAEQDIELMELKRAKSSSKKFFINNWFMFDEQWVIDYLGMGQYYKYAIRIDDFDKIFDEPVEKIEEIIATMSSGQKKSIAYRARQLIADGTIDSNKKILALEKALDTELVDRF